MQAAPYFADIAEGPPGDAVWARTPDGVRIRVGLWRTGVRGTVVVFPGRGEYVEKYGPMAADLAARGFATAAIDWRGQGLADRLLPDPLVGHVEAFADYQRDVAAAMDAVRAEGLPEPVFAVAHSMGGAIALRSLIEGIRADAAAFTAPMWGMRFGSVGRPAAWALASGARRVGLANRYAPGTGPGSYVATTPAEGNVLTSDPAMYALMARQIAAHPELALGGPSLHWVGAALAETRALRRLASPAVPALTVLGSRERVIDPAAVTERMARWPGGRLERIEGAEHEIIMERPALREAFFDAIAELFAAS